MKRITVIVGVLGAMSVLAGCSMSPGSASANPDTVTVTATGIGHATPDALQANLSIQSNAATTSSAQDQASQDAAKVIRALETGGVAKADITTSNVSVQPNMTTNGTIQTQSGYTASQSLTITLRDVATAGSLVSSAVAAAGNAVRVDNTMLIVTNPESASIKARQSAVSTARRQAQQYAQALGFTLGSVASVTEGATTPMPMLAATDTRVAGGPASVPIEPGTADVTGSVTISWHIN